MKNAPMQTEAQPSERDLLIERVQLHYLKAVYQAGLRYADFAIESRDDMLIVRISPIGAETESIVSELAAQDDVIDGIPAIVETARVEHNWQRLGLRPDERVRLRDEKAYQEYRTRYWRRRGKMPMFMPNLTAVYQVNNVWGELYKGTTTPVAGVQQIEPAIGRGSAFILPQDDLVVVEDQAPTE